MMEYYKDYKMLDWALRELANVTVAGYAVYRSKYTVTRSYYYRCVSSSGTLHSQHMHVHMCETHVCFVLPSISCNPGVWDVPVCGAGAAAVCRSPVTVSLNRTFGSTWHATESSRYGDQSHTVGTVKQTQVPARINCLELYVCPGL